ncbi:metallopeptidase family M12-like protein [Tahibacter aquaticus]|uniref:Metallopeptidase family M12-like protein n=1 Tax=Tahibacter aquaticus TaxID=520092 RepID=A0A4R6Z9F4_9GAMM|nr:M12 family metallo-peptidase [Tahibacter aquaticus]TDR48530.1 metallopeptidase family M12-like protein [Tahibacter aquaticus]
MRLSILPLALAAGLGGTPPAAAASQPAWTVDGALSRPELQRQRGSVAALRIRIDLHALQQADSLDLALPGGRSQRIEVVRREPRGGGDSWIIGRFAGETDALVSLSLSNGILGGLISAPEGNYEITTLADGHQAVLLLDQDEFPECATRYSEHAVAGDTAPAAALAPDADPANRTDVLIVLSPEALIDVGGNLAQATAFAQSAVDSSNLAFRNSDMTTRFRLAGVRLTARAETGNTGTDLPWLRDDAEVASWRNQTGADMVSLITRNLNACGVGYLQSSPGPGFAGSAFQVTTRGCAVGNLSYAHEHGHNMGMGHDPGNGNGAHAWSNGHFVNGSFRTVMSYDTNCVGGCPRKPYFSNPAVNFSGQPTGIADTRDNHRTGNLTADIVANFRASQIIFQDGLQPAQP